MYIDYKPKIPSSFPQECLFEKFARMEKDKPEWAKNKPLLLYCPCPKCGSRYTL